MFINSTHVAGRILCVSRPANYETTLLMSLLKKVAHDGEQVNQDQSQNCRQDDGPAGASDTFNDIEQSLFSVY